MSSHKNFSIFTIVAIGACLFILPTYAKLIDKKIYLVRRFETPTESDFLIGVEVGINKEGKEVSAGIFGILPKLWGPLYKYVLSKYVPDHLTIEEVTLDEVPVPGLITIVKYRPQLYSEALPSLLDRTTPKIIAESLPAHLLKTLTPEAKSQIDPEYLKELEKLYDSMKNSA